MTRQDVEISVVIPVYGCSACLPELHQRLTDVLEGLTTAFEILVVDDCSRDDAWQVIRGLADRDRRIRACRMSRNFGQHAAITAGLAESRGQWVVVMDCDLQDPPEEIPRLYAEIKQGYDVVLARRSEKRHSLIRRSLSHLYFILLGRLTNEKVDGSFGSFSMISRKVVDAFLRVQDRDRHYLFIIRWLGFRLSQIEYMHGERLTGTSSYTLGSLIQHGINGMFFQTTVLLRWIVYLGFFISLSGLILTAFLIYQYFFMAVAPGWTSLAVLILVVGGFILLSTGITGLYIGKVFDQVKGRPLYLVDERIDRDLET